MNRVEIKRLGMIGLLLLSEPRQTEYVALICYFKTSNSRFTKYCHPHLREGLQIRVTGSRDHTERKVCSRVRALLNTVTSR